MALKTFYTIFIFRWLDCIKKLAGKKSRSAVDIEAIEKAIQDVQNGTKVSVAARNHNILRSNLTRRLKNSSTRSGVGRETALSPELDLRISSRLSLCSDWGYPLDLKETGNIIS